MWQKQPYKILLQRLQSFLQTLQEPDACLPLLCIHPRATSTSNGETSDTASTNGWSQWTHLPNSLCKQKRSPRTRRDKRGNIQRNPRPSKMTMVPTQQHTRWTEIHSHHHKGNNSISAHHYPQQVPQHSQIVVQQDSSMAAALRQMAQLHQ